MIGEALKVLLSPLGYLKAKNPTKIYWDWIIPLIAATVASAIFINPWLRITVFGDKGVVNGVNELIQVLVGFYIAALAAVASLANPALDRGVAGEPIKSDGKDLTRRQFLCIAFSYLSLLSISIYGLGVLSNIISEPIRSALPAGWILYTRGVFGLIYGFTTTQLACITSVTLYYLGERIHTADLVANPMTIVEIDPAANNEGPHVRSARPEASE
ncbi:hypothetical protein VDG05_22015 [Xanthomonas campestris pv. raphani]|uniref:hypothetical protein n=1 Tax=Xanthomonas TaxID=338 RepID=UPI001611E778|nr:MULTISPECIES: hypothetical protein [Xanthomonas]MBB3761413.1 hypothetical protein [Xanthomonas arboricola]MEA9886947.1 hypothetical protein [Xanthomonas campestris pv. raphani]MEB2183876.1 hypothetical protein [Xanthomonas campestris pv. campestris]